MIALTRQEILAHQKNVPWVEFAQVEQNLLLSLAMVVLFNDSFFVITDRDESHVRAAIERVLRSVLASHKAFGWHAI